MSEFDGDSLWAWQVYDADEKWGVIAATIPGVGLAPSPLITRNEAAARGHLGPLARMHGITVGRPVRLARFDLAEVYGER